MKAELSLPSSTRYNIRIKAIGSHGQSSFFFRHKMTEGYNDIKSDQTEGFLIDLSKGSQDMSSVIPLDTFVGKVKQLQMIFYNVISPPDEKESPSFWTSWWAEYFLPALSYHSDNTTERINVLPEVFQYMSEETKPLRALYSNSYSGDAQWIKSNNIVTFYFE